ncbi:hypothetical protein C2G38_2110105, partial [Gigaspora rosea]
PHYFFKKYPKVVQQHVKQIIFILAMLGKIVIIMIRRKFLSNKIIIHLYK